MQFGTIYLRFLCEAAGLKGQAKCFARETFMAVAGGSDDPGRRTLPGFGAAGLCASRRSGAVLGQIWGKGFDSRLHL